ncbi:mechanosensitive ion channel family protein [Aquidulcibacter sp.]|jgi:small conductance mechanosensitive channel|uniref:mechanosensitive ion channel family protein n=1 Tax=Aquidulcibacter sp. TaxID=2052990 RepID=UPI003782E5E0
MTQFQTDILPTLIKTGLETAVNLGLKALGAIALWFIGRWVIGLIGRAITRALLHNAMDRTIKTWIGSIVTIGLNIFLVIAILNVFGIETTSLAALVAAAGLAVGAAWSGLLSNFAAGVFLILFKPFKVGDFITAAGVTGTVTEIGMFATAINTLENVRTIIGNNAVSTAIIQNFSANPYRAVDLRVQLAASVSPDEARAMLLKAVTAIPNVITDPAPVIEIIEFTEAGPKLLVRPFCHNDHYWQVVYDTHKAIAATFGDAGFPQPSVARAVKNV